MTSYNRPIRNSNVIHFYHAKAWTLVRSSPSMAFTIVSGAFFTYYWNMSWAVLMLLGFLWMAIHHLRHNMECVGITSSMITFKLGFMGLHHESVSLWNPHFEIKRSFLGSLFGYATLRVFHNHKVFEFRGLEDPSRVEAYLIDFPPVSERRPTYLIEMNPDGSYIDSGRLPLRRRARREKVQR